MAALDLGVASSALVVPSTPFTELPFGTAVFPADPAHVVAAVGDVDVVPRLSADGAIHLSTASGAFTPSIHGALFIAIYGPTSGDAWTVAALTDAFVLVLSDTSVYAAVSQGENLTPAPLTLDTPHSAGLTVYAIVSSATERFVANSHDGVLATAAPASSPVSTAGSSDLPASSGSGTASIAGMWHFDSVNVSQADALDTLASIQAMLGGDAGTVEGATAWDMTATATVTVGETPIGGALTTDAPGGTAVLPSPPAIAWPEDPLRVGLRHVWARYGAPTLEDSRPVDWLPEASGAEQVGYIQTIVQGVDISIYLGAETPIPDWEHLEPFGFGSATITLPQLTTFHTTPAWAVGGANVHIRFVPFTGDPVTLYRGFVAQPGSREDEGVFTLECDGLLFTANIDLRRPSFDQTPRDIGTVIPDLLNAIPGRRYGVMDQVVTGIRTSVAGGWDAVLTGFVQDALATAVTGGNQWTVALDDATPELRLKDTSTVAWAVRTGQEGVKIDLVTPTVEAPNVIFGEGIAPDGGRWRNSKYPNMHLDDTPAYPNADPDDTIRVGTTDASTDSGTGVSTWQTKAGVTVTGVFTRTDRAALVAIQRASGITVDGFLGPQSWAATFNTGANTGTLDGAFIAPLVAAPAVMARLYGPDGDDLGPNPAYDPNVLWVPRYINFGSGVTKDEGTRAASEILARDVRPGWVGTITLTEVSPEAKHRYLLRAGENVQVLGWHGETLLMHVARVKHTSTSTTVTVDTNARDFPTLDAIMERDRAAVDPARKALDKIMASRVTNDRPVYDAESKAGRLPRHAIFANLWDVRKIPMGAYGTISRTEVTTTGSANPFALAVFAKPVTAAMLLSVVGNPLSSALEDDPWQEHGDALDAMGLLQSWGWAKQPAGYYPRQASNPNGESTAPVTGRLVDDASWDYATELAPWIWVATIAPASCYVEGRFYGAPEGR